jgi:hypothetical protein
LAALKYFGPGAIIASIGIGSGETVFASRGGAMFGYTLLWAWVLGALLKWAQVYSAARYMTLTGEHPIERWAFLPGPRKWFPLLIGVSALLTFPFWMGGLAGMLGTLCAWITGVGDKLTWGLPFLLVVIVIALFESYGVLELVEKIIIGILISCILVAAVASRPDILAMLKGAVVPIIPSGYESWISAKYPALTERPVWIELITYFGLLGGGSHDYLGYLGTLREKFWGALSLPAVRERGRSLWSGHSSLFPAPSLSTDLAQVKLGRLWLRAPFMDSSISFACVLIFTIAFAVCGATMLRPQQLIPNGVDLFEYQAQFLSGLHASLLYIYQVGLFFVFFGTLYAVLSIFARTAFELFRVMTPRVVSLKNVRNPVIAYAGGGGILVLLTGWDPVAVITPASIIGGVLGCGLWALGMVWCDRTCLPPAYRMGRGLTILVWCAGVTFTGIGLFTLVQWIAGFLQS